MVFAKHNWAGNFSVQEGTHLKILSHSRGYFLRVRVRDKAKKEEGYVFNEILRPCPDHLDQCSIATENYDAFLYLIFNKGDRIILDKDKLVDNGWLFGRLHSKRLTNYIFEQSGEKEFPICNNTNYGYIHPRWINSANSHIGFVFVRFLGLSLTISDVITDIINGDDYIHGADVDADVDADVCADINNYSHPIWGSVAIGIAWLPALPICANEIVYIWQTYGNRYTPIKSLKMFLFVIFLSATWPITGLLM